MWWHYHNIKYMKNVKNFFEKTSYSKIFVFFVALLVVWIIFVLGVFVGYHKAEFSYSWNENYQGGMMNNNSPFAPFMHDADDVNPHGSIGQIISVRYPVVMIKGQGSAEQMVIIGSTTVIRFMHGIASTSTIQAGEYAVAIGEPNNQGEIQASFIRIVPPPPNMINASGTATSTN